jgi:hypothetical protein
MKVPKNVKTHIANSRYYLGALGHLPQPVAQGVRILLLLTAWEHMHIASKFLESKVWNTPTSRELLRSHKEKLQGVRGPIVHLRDAGGGKLIEKAYMSPEELSELLEVARYGPKNILVELGEFFNGRWITDEFERDLENRLGWLEAEVKIFDEIQSGKTFVL